jgi:hypothetical protein
MLPCFESLKGALEVSESGESGEHSSRNLGFWFVGNWEVNFWLARQPGILPGSAQLKIHAATTGA